ncbi:MAG: mechanosensitive ion channel [Thiohalocapsa sp.]|nr:mechanosensitive ion channel [Thiohalocapsa sp.]
MNYRTALALGVVLALLASGMGAIAADEPAEAQPLTTADPDLPTEELELLLKPLTKDQLLVEAQAWQSLVQEKAEEIARAEIAIKRQNREIDMAAEIQKEAEAAKNEREAVEAEARESGDSEAMAKVEEAAESAREQTAPADSLSRTEQAMAASAREKKEEKVLLLEQLAELREQRTVLLDQLKAVLAALEVKTDAEDTETLAKIRDYRLYASAVRGVDLDVKDTTSAWLAIKGWATSGEGGIRVGLNVLTFFGILIAAWLVSGIFSALIHRAMKRISGTSKLLEEFLVKAARWVVMAIGVIMALAALEVSIGPLLALVGAAGFVIAFALQDSLSNFASGMMILFFKPFDVGDVVDAGGVSGTVGSMNLVSTTIKTFDNKKMIVPNNKIWSDVIVNASGASERRVDMEFGIGYDDDIDRAQSILEEVVSSHPQVLKEPAPTIRLSALADSSVNFIVRPWAKTADYWQVYWDLTRAVKQRFDAEGIGIPFPQRDVHLYLGNPETANALRQLAQSPPGERAPGENDRQD